MRRLKWEEKVLDGRDPEEIRLQTEAERQYRLQFGPEAQERLDGIERRIAQLTADAEAHQPPGYAECLRQAQTQAEAARSCRNLDSFGGNVDEYMDQFRDAAARLLEDQVPYRAEATAEVGPTIANGEGGAAAIKNKADAMLVRALSVYNTKLLLLRGLKDKGRVTATNTYQQALDFHVEAIMEEFERLQSKGLEQ
jgi:hypothetical protein